MACYLRPSVRDVLVRLFRAEVYRRAQFVEFEHQAEVRLATEGLTLTSQVVPEPDSPPLPYDPDDIRPELYAIKATPVKLMVAATSDESGAFEINETGNFVRYEWRMAEPRTHVTITAAGPELEVGVIAHKASDLASFKAGKSKNTGMWLTGFAPLPGATIDMVGLTYETSEPEYNYLTEALLSGSKPIIKKPKHYQNSVDQGRMYLELSNGCSWGVRSWKNKDALRGGQVTCYAFNEIYQLPGLTVYTGHAQNLRVEKGYTLFTSTPDKPWLKKLHLMGHGRHPDWHCSCGTNARTNPFAFDLSSFMGDAPDWDTIIEFAPALLSLCRQSGLEPGALMSREKFMISWLGMVGNFVGAVYAFNREAITCNPKTHPQIFRPSVVKAFLAQQAILKDLRADA